MKRTRTYYKDYTEAVENKPARARIWYESKKGYYTVEPRIKPNWWER